MSGPANPEALRAVLEFYRDNGVDVALGDEPVDRFAHDDAPLLAPAAAPLSSPPKREPAPALRPETAPVLAPEAAAIAARALAHGATSLDHLRTLLQGFDGCTLKVSAKQMVFADGTPDARVMFIGEAPGSEEDLLGKPFVGPSGQLLDRMMAAIGLDRTSAYIANIIPWRPPGNRPPTPLETAICLPFIQRHIALTKAEIIVCLGNSSVQTLLGTKDGITKTRGRWFDYDADGRMLRALATFHPAYLLRTPISKRQCWADFQALGKVLAVPR